jgi:hypothetical protein
MVKKQAAVLCGAALLLICGCIYDVPLAEEAVVPIPPGLAGTWQLIPAEGEPGNPEAQLLIVPFSKTEYVVICMPGKKDRLIFRAYPVHLNGLELIQLEWLQAGPEQNRYHVCRYVPGDGTLEVQTLNRELIGEDIADSAGLREAVKENCRNPKAFDAPMLFHRIK